jgi:hypothetical protein
MKKLKIILSIIFTALLFIAIPVYSSEAEIKTATDSVTSTLTVIVEPAFESTEIGSDYQETPTNITISKTIGVRANTSWSLNYQPISNGFVNQANCYLSNQAGLSNGQAGVGNAFQLIDIVCWQEKSWGDQPDATIDINYSLSSDTRLGV